MQVVFDQKQSNHQGIFGDVSPVPQCWKRGQLFGAAKYIFHRVLLLLGRWKSAPVLIKSWLVLWGQAITVLKIGIGLTLMTNRQCILHSIWHIGLVDDHKVLKKYLCLVSLMNLIMRKTKCYTLSTPWKINIKKLWSLVSD